MVKPNPTQPLAHPGDWMDSQSWSARHQDENLAKYLLKSHFHYSGYSWKMRPIWRQWVLAESAEIRAHPKSCLFCVSQYLIYGLLWLHFCVSVVAWHQPTPLVLVPSRTCQNTFHIIGAEYIFVEWMKESLSFLQMLTSVRHSLTSIWVKGGRNRARNAWEKYLPDAGNCFSQTATQCAHEGPWAWGPEKPFWTGWII